MRIKNASLFNELEKQLIQFSDEIFNLRGIELLEKRIVFINQLIDSIRRVDYIFAIDKLELSNARTDPVSIFDPLKAAIIFKRRGMIDEAFWLIFLYIHFSKNLYSGWRLLQDIYGSLGNSNHWTWERITSDHLDFKKWLKNNYNKLTSDKIRRGFGNHRKFETLNPTSPHSTAFVIESYVKWINPPKTHSDMIKETSNEYGNNPRILFEKLYDSMNNVLRFGRLAKFEYLTMIAKLGLAPIEPGKTFLKNSTGPTKGALLLIYNNINKKINTTVLEEKLILLENNLSVGKFGMQVLEDAICNWQKSPSIYKYFAG